MQTRVLLLSIAMLPISLVSASRAGAQLMSRCVENSPERRGELGCSIIENKTLPTTLKEPLFWHIDRFDSAERARAAVGPASVSFEAAATSWLMTIESKTSNHHGGTHVSQVGPLPLPKAPTYSMQVLSSVFTPGMYSLAHHHSGVEAVYVIDGEACYETPTRGFRLRKGETVALPTGTPMRAVATGSKPRYVLAVIVYDAAQPATMPIEKSTSPQFVACK
jgi:quercetin dioxygenase-like cupin family protein